MATSLSEVTGLPSYIRASSKKADYRVALKKHFPGAFANHTDYELVGDTECIINDAIQYIRSVRRTPDNCSTHAWHLICEPIKNAFISLLQAHTTTTMSDEEWTLLWTFDIYKLLAALKHNERSKRSKSAAAAADDDDTDDDEENVDLVEECLWLAENPCMACLPLYWNAMMDCHDDQVKSLVIEHIILKWIVPTLCAVKQGLYNDTLNPHHSYNIDVEAAKKCRVFLSGISCDDTNSHSWFWELTTEPSTNDSNDIVLFGSEELRHSLAEADYQMFQFAALAGQLVLGRPFTSITIISIDSDILTNGLWFVSKTEVGRNATAVFWRASIARVQQPYDDDDEGENNDDDIPFWQKRKREIMLCNLTVLAQHIRMHPNMITCPRPVQTIATLLVSCGSDYTYGFQRINHEKMLTTVLENASAEEVTAVCAPLSDSQETTTQRAYGKWLLLLYGLLYAADKKGFSSRRQARSDKAIRGKGTRYQFNKQHKHRPAKSKENTWIHSQRKHLHLAVLAAESIGKSHLNLPARLEDWAYEKVDDGYFHPIYARSFQ